MNTQYIRYGCKGWSCWGFVELSILVDVYDDCKSISGMISFLEDPNRDGTLLDDVAPFDIMLYDKIEFSNAPLTDPLKFGRPIMNVLGVVLNESKSGPVSFDNEQYRLGFTFKAHMLSFRFGKFPDGFTETFNKCVSTVSI
jgi:hypothetical protein